MANPKGENYHEQPGCHCCYHCLIERCPDSGPSYFCIADGVPPPLAPTGPYDAEELDVYFAARTLWEPDRDVQPQGICNKFTRTDPLI